MKISDCVQYRGLLNYVISFDQNKVCIGNDKFNSIDFVSRHNLVKDSVVSNLWRFTHESERERPDRSLGQESDESKQEYLFNRGLHETGEQAE